MQDGSGDGGGVTGSAAAQHTRNFVDIEFN